jgi:hypothetical protein
MPGGAGAGAGAGAAAPVPGYLRTNINPSSIKNKEKRAEVFQKMRQAKSAVKTARRTKRKREEEETGIVQPRQVSARRRSLSAQRRVHEDVPEARAPRAVCCRVRWTRATHIP